VEELLGVVVSVQSMQRPYNESQLLLEENLEIACERVGGWCEMDANLGVSGVEE
jgi:hypothetical protein